MPRTVAVVAPYFLDTTRQFIRAAAVHPGVRVGLVSSDPVRKLPADLRRRLRAHERIPNALDASLLAPAVRRLGTSLAGPGGRVARLIGTLEQLQEALAAVREQLGIPGMGLRAARNFRDKARMKDVMRRAGIPCARHRLLARHADAHAFARAVGFPIVLKPPDGAGAKGTQRVDDAASLESALRRHPPSPARPLLAEELVRGSEHSFDGVSIDGKLVWHSITHYLPAPLEVVENPWIQWCVLLPRELEDPAFDDIRQVAAAALTALGMDTGISHLEWFRRPDGSLAISEVGARPGGAQISKLISYAHDIDFYRAWAGVVIDGRFDPPQQHYAAGAAYLRGQGQGRVAAIRGLEQAQEEIGHLVVESNLPRLGQAPTGSYEGEGYVIVRHAQTEVVEHALRRIVSLVRVELG